jgi:hypothetical protein
MTEQLFNVRLETVSLAKGAMEERRMMTERQLDEWLKSVHSPAKVSEIVGVAERCEKRGAQFRVCISPTVTISPAS